MVVKLLDGWTDGQVDGWKGRAVRRRASGVGHRLTASDTKSFGRLCSWLLMVPYRKLEAWKVAHELALKIYLITDDRPRCERYQLTSQLRRAALSIPTNIAEGVAKRGSREFRRYLDIARSLLCEVSYLLLFSKDRGILGLGAYQSLGELRDRVGKVMWGLYRSLSRQSTG
jgi:four helix bundle protein